MTQLKQFKYKKMDLKEGDDYILMHPDTVKYIWCPDIYIGQ